MSPMLTGETENRAIIKYGGVVYSQHRRVVATGGECRMRTTLGSHSHQILFPKFTRKRSSMVQQPSDARSRHGLHIQSSVIEAEGNVKPIGTRICLAR